MDRDDLEDVVLEGRFLVSSDPTTWIIPQGMIEAEGPLEWWELLMKADRVLDPAVVHACQGAIAAYHNEPPWWQSRVISHVKVMMGAGLTISQIRDVTNVPIYDIFGPALVKAWTDLQDGVPLESVLAGLSPANQKHVRSFHNILHGKARTPSLKARRPDILAFALDRWYSGTDRKTICNEIWERWGESVKPDAISQWVSRDKQQREMAS